MSPWAISTHRQEFTIAETLPLSSPSRKRLFDHVMLWCGKNDLVCLSRSPEIICRQNLNWSSFHRASQSFLLRSLLNFTVCDEHHCLCCSVEYDIRGVWYQHLDSLSSQYYITIVIADYIRWQSGVQGWRFFPCKFGMMTSPNLGPSGWHHQSCLHLNLLYCSQHFLSVCEGWP